MDLPGFTADLSLSRLSGQRKIGTRIRSSGDSTGQIYPARLKNENEGVNCDTCVGAQCVGLGCLDVGIGGGGDGLPCLSSSQCSACIPSGPSIFSPGRQFCIDSFCSPGFGGSCRCRVFKGFRSCQVPRPVLTTRL